MTGSKANPTPITNVTQIPGQRGLRRKIFNSSVGLYLDSLVTNPNFNMTVGMDLEAQANYWSGFYGNHYTGYFKAPATANYRFYMSCDDACMILLSNVTLNDSAKMNVLQFNGANSYRNYITLDGSRNSAWVNLTKGEYYPLEVRHVNYGGPDHLSIALEIEDPTISPGH